jgi:hypothetical protein
MLTSIELDEVLFVVVFESVESTFLR